MFQVFELYEGNSPLHRMNPVVKLLVTAVSLVGLTLVFDPYVPLALLIVVVACARAAGVPVGAMLRGLLPSGALALGFFWMQVAFPRGDPTGYTLLAHVGPVPVYRETLLRGLALGLRVLCYAAYGLLFVATTDPTRLVLSLIQNAGLSPRFGYSLLAAYRLFPLYQSELRTLRMAHQVRGVEEGAGVRGGLARLSRYAIPLLAGAVRRAERVAVAMESRGFTGRRERTYYLRVEIRPQDLALALAYLLVPLAVVAAARFLGVLEVWDGSLYF